MSSESELMTTNLQEHPGIISWTFDKILFFRSLKNSLKPDHLLTLTGESPENWLRMIPPNSQGRRQNKYDQI